MDELRSVVTKAVQQRLTLWNAMRLAGDAPPPEGFDDLADACLSAIKEAGYDIVRKRGPMAETWSTAKQAWPPPSNMDRSQREG